MLVMQEALPLVFLSRAASNPLVIRAQAVKDFVNPIVSNAADMASIMVENQQVGSLERENVVFVK